MMLKKIMKNALQDIGNITAYAAYKTASGALSTAKSAADTSLNTANGELEAVRKANSH
jgi:hypothetical protein